MVGQNVGVKTILVESGYGTAKLEEKVETNHVCRDLREVAEMLQ